MFKPLGSIFTVLKKVLVTFLGLFATLAVIRRPGNCAPLAPLVKTLHLTHSPLVESDHMK